MLDPREGLYEEGKQGNMKPNDNKNYKTPWKFVLISGELLTGLVN